MKKIIYFICLTLLFSCSNNTKSQQTNTPVVGLDLISLNEIVKGSSSAAEIEQKVNAPNGINNVDLDGDGNVDYIRVVGYATPVYGYEFRALTSDGREHYIARIDFNKNAGIITTTGNPVYYTTNNYYETPYNSNTWLICAWLFYHPIYVSPYYYGHYGYGYRPYRCVSYNVYHQRNTVYVTRSSNTHYVTKTVSRPVSNPSQNRVSTAPTTNKSLSNQTSFKKEMTTRDVNKPINTNGFSNKKPTAQPTTQPTTQHTSSPAVKRSGFSGGGGRRR